MKISNRTLLVMSSLLLVSTLTISKPLDNHPTMTLWPDQPPGNISDQPQSTLPERKDNVTRITNVSQPAITFYEAQNASSPAPAVIICPGGGYRILSMDSEGTEIAQWLNSFGIHAFVLKYRVPENRQGAFQDIQRAMGLIRQYASDRIDPNCIGVMGFSAGAHLSAKLSTNYQNRSYSPFDNADDLSCKPDFTILIYPAYLSDDDYKTPEDINVTKDTPPAFIFQTENDKHVNSSIAYYLALKKQKVPAELHLYPRGGHGYGLRPGNPAAQIWPTLCRSWIESQVLKK